MRHEWPNWVTVHAVLLPDLRAFQKGDEAGVMAIYYNSSPLKFIRCTKTDGSQRDAVLWPNGMVVMPAYPAGRIYYDSTDSLTLAGWSWAFADPEEVEIPL
jgi:hypothetical protein